MNSKDCFINSSGDSSINISRIYVNRTFQTISTFKKTFQNCCIIPVIPSWNISKITFFHQQLLFIQKQIFFHGLFQIFDFFWEISKRISLERRPRIPSKTSPQLQQIFLEFLPKIFQNSLQKFIQSFLPKFFPWLFFGNPSSDFFLHFSSVFFGNSYTSVRKLLLGFFQDFR